MDADVGIGAPTDPQWEQRRRREGEHHAADKATGDARRDGQDCGAPTLGPSEPHGGEHRRVFAASPEVTSHCLRHDEQAGHAGECGGHVQGVALQRRGALGDLERGKVVGDVAVVDAHREVGHDGGGVAAIVEVNKKYGAGREPTPPLSVEERRATDRGALVGRIGNQVGGQPDDADDRRFADRLRRAAHVAGD